MIRTISRKGSIANRASVAFSRGDTEVRLINRVERLVGGDEEKISITESK